MYHNWCPAENEYINGVSPPDLFEGCTRTRGGGVLGIVSPTLPDDAGSSSTSPSVNSFCQSGIAGVSQSCRRICIPMPHLHRFQDLSRQLTPGTYTNFRLSINDVATWSQRMWAVVLPFIRARLVSLPINDWTVTNMSKSLT